MIFLTGSQIHSPLKPKRDQGDVSVINSQLRKRLSEEMFYRWLWILTAGYLSFCLVSNKKNWLRTTTKTKE